MSATPRQTPIAWPLVTVLAVAVAAVAVSFAIWCSTSERGVTRREAPEDVSADQRLGLVLREFAELPGWADDALIEARPALEHTCAVWKRRDPDASIAAHTWAGTAADWREGCTALMAATTTAEMRRALERHFVPYQVLAGSHSEGLFTGYYEPLLHGSRTRTDRYRVPLYRKPDDIVEIDLAHFHERFAGQRISGRLTADSFEPYFERAEIAAGALDGRGLELVWVDDAVDAFFLHVQGSGRVSLAEGGEVRVGYAGQNGRPYFAIGRELVERGELTLPEVSLQSIRAWLASHPEQAQEVMAANPSFIFFRQLEGEGPVGTLGVPLTPGRSLAVDSDHLPLGAPVWLDVMTPRADGVGEVPLQRLLVAQDTGGAIRGPVRGDVFWGHGSAAEAIAGRMKHQGRLWLLLPRSLERRALPTTAS